MVPKLGGGGGSNLRGSGASSLASEGGPFKPDTWDILLISDLDKKVRHDRLRMWLAVTWGTDAAWHSSVSTVRSYGGVWMG